MKITIVIGPFFPMPPILGGAVERLWHQLAELFAAQGHEVTIICRQYNNQPNNEILNGVYYIRRSGFTRTGYIVIDLIWALLYSWAIIKYLPKSDILITNCVGLPLIASWFRPQAGKIVACVHRYPKLDLYFYGKSAQFVTPSRAIAKAIAEKFPALQKKTTVVGNPIRTDIFYPRDCYKPSQDEKTILFVGRIHPEKGIDLLIEAFSYISAELSNVRLQIVGPASLEEGGGGTGYQRALLHKVEALNVEIQEPIFDIKELAEIYRLADVFCYPSLAEQGETFGLAVLEAMGCGLVPIVSSLDCFADFVKNGETGLVFDHRVPDAANNLAKKLEICLTNSRLRTQLGNNASTKAKEFSLSNIAHNYLTNFQNIISR